MCSCTKDNPCPLEGQCLKKNVIYQATVTQEDQTKNSYTGLCSTEFKKRLAVHKQTFKDETKQQTSLSKFTWNLKRKNKNYEITWKILDRGEPFSPISGRCELCLKEKFYILFRPESADINSRDEFFSACRHRISNLLIPHERKKKKKDLGEDKKSENSNWIKIFSCGLVLILASMFSYLFKPEESTPVLETSQ